MKIRKIILKTKRLILRPFKISDAKEYFKLGESTWRMGKINSLAKAKKLIKNSWKHDSFYFGIFLKDTGELVGQIELCHMSWWANHGVELAYRIKKEHRRKGYVTEASKKIIDYCFKTLKFHKIYGDTDIDNKISQRIAKKLGFKLEGRSREKNLVNGRWKDELNFGLLKKEWKK